MLTAGVVFHSHGSYYIDAENDFINSYIPHAEKLLAGNLVVDDFRGPVYIIMLTLVKLLLGDYFIAGIFISALSGSLFLFFIYKILLAAAGKRAAYYVLLLSAVNPYVFMYSYAPGTDMLAAAAVSGGIYFFISKKIFASAVLLCVAFLTRYNTGVVLLFIPMIIMGSYFISSKLHERIEKTAVFIITALIVLLPWGYYTYEKRGEVFYNENYKNVAVALEQEYEFNWEQSWAKVNNKYSSMEEVVTEDISFTLVSFAKNTALNFFKLIKKFNHTILSIVFLIGLFYLPKYKPGRELSVYLILTAVIFLSLGFSFFNVRFFLLLIPVYSFIIYKGMNFLIETYSISISKNALRPLILFIILFISGYHTAAVNSGTLKSPDELVTAGKVKGIIGDKYDGYSLAAYHPHIPYILGLKWVPLPYSFPGGKSMNELKSAGADLLFIGKREKEFRKELGTFNEYRRPGIVEAYRFKFHEAAIYILY